MSTVFKAIGAFLIGFAIVQLVFTFVIKPENNSAPIPPSVSRADSLQNVVDSLQNEITMLETNFDYKEGRYEDIIFEYELGISYLKDYHPGAYKDFHRLIGMRERFTSELEKENCKRLKNYK